MRAMPASVICISHAEGAGGQEVAKLLAERLGYRYIDDGIIISAAQADHAYPEAVALAESRHTGRKIEVDFNRVENTEALRDRIRDAIHATADEGSVVIAAHAASFALAERPEVLRILVTASSETRQQRIAEADGRDAKAAAKQLKESDKGRASYLKSFYGVGEELPTHFDLVVNTDRLPAESAVDAIAHAVPAD
jgi:cytidylate kinase